MKESSPEFNVAVIRTTKWRCMDEMRFWNSCRLDDLSQRENVINLTKEVAVSNELCDSWIIDNNCWKTPMGRSTPDLIIIEKNESDCTSAASHWRAVERRRPNGSTNAVCGVSKLVLGSATRAGPEYDVSLSRESKWCKDGNACAVWILSFKWHSCLKIVIPLSIHSTSRQARSSGEKGRRACWIPRHS